ncbi:MAG: hypothetical protein K2Q23_16870 [Bryobacteraceae bacterium]|nr:hypothetical protein [Bryobacteraceae bacterium]
MVRKKARLVALVLLILVASSSCARERRVRVGSKNFTEQLILGELISLLIERDLKMPVERALNLGGVEIAHQALISGQIDLYPEYTATAVAMVLKQEVIPDRQALLQNCRNEYGNQFQAEWLDPLGFDNSFVMVASGERARQLGILKLSEASAADPGWRLGVGYEFENRKDGLPALQKAYNLPMAAAPKIMDLGLLYKALADKQVDLVAANATDGLLSTLDVKILLDDKEVFPPYEAAVVVRKSALDEVKGLRAVLNKLSGKISSETMRRLNYEVDGKKRPPRAVAAEFLATLK